ncbi:hypothetical protein CHS0354_007234 [Potamilus streckersoni]|uniref:Uncharacterized protein n=1 Tax=Potamilus streckersoni TaxID=2493646 RepID=A0AAE0RYA3_9BIVA|nr:hypothetical protein CHS0354_007234 [Potamilus streckersoni]
MITSIPNDKFQYKFQYRSDGLQGVQENVQIIMWKSIEYPILTSAIKPVPDDNSPSIPAPAEKWSLDETNEDDAMHHLSTDSDIDPDFELHVW